MAWSGAEIIHCVLNCMSAVMVLTSIGVPDWSKRLSGEQSSVEFGFFIVRLCRDRLGDCDSIHRGPGELESFERASFWCTVLVACLSVAGVVLILLIVQFYYNRFAPIATFTLCVVCGLALIIQVISVSSYSLSAVGRVLGDGWNIALIATTFLLATTIAAVVVHIDHSCNLTFGMESIADRAINAPVQWEPQAWASDDTNQFIPMEQQPKRLSKFLNKVRKKSVGIGIGSNLPPMEA